MGKKQISNKQLIDEISLLKKEVGEQKDRLVKNKQAHILERQSEKLNVLGQLSGGLAHNFNNLLTIIMGYCDFALDDLNEENTARRYVQEIKNVGLRAGKLIKQLLAFSRKQVLLPKVISINKLLSNMNNMIKPIIGADIKLTMKLDKNLGNVKADPSQIEQMILNLIINARDAMPDGGKLTIRTSNDKLSERYNPEGTFPVKAGQYVLIEISDTGIGIPNEIRTKIFEPFFTTKNKTKGTGLGLSSVYGIVKQSEGYIWVNSNPEKGSTFKIFLPKITAGITKVIAKEVTQISYKGNETVLVVEDEDELREIITINLKKNGYDVLTACNGENALKVLKNHKAPIHMLVTDLVMPKMSGIKLVQEVTKSFPDIRVIFISGYTQEEIANRGPLKESVEFIYKPFTRDQLLARIREVFQRSR